MDLLKQWFLTQNANDWLMLSVIFKISLFLSALIIFAIVVRAYKKNDWSFFIENLVLVGLFIFMFNMIGQFSAVLYFREGFDNASISLSWNNSEYRLKLYDSTFYILKPEQFPKYEYFKKNISSGLQDQVCQANGTREIELVYGKVLCKEYSIKECITKIEHQLPSIIKTYQNKTSYEKDYLPIEIVKQ